MKLEKALTEVQLASRQRNFEQKLLPILKGEKGIRSPKDIIILQQQVEELRELFGELETH